MQKSDLKTGFTTCRETKVKLLVCVVSIDCLRYIVTHIFMSLDCFLAQEDVGEKKTIKMAIIGV